MACPSHTSNHHGQSAGYDCFVFDFLRAKCSHTLLSVTAAQQYGTPFGKCSKSVECKFCCKAFERAAGCRQGGTIRVESRVTRSGARVIYLWSLGLILEAIFPPSLLVLCLQEMLVRASCFLAISPMEGPSRYPTHHRTTSLLILGF